MKGGSGKRSKTFYSGFLKTALTSSLKGVVLNKSVPLQDGDVILRLSKPSDIKKIGEIQDNVLPEFPFSFLKRLFYSTFGRKMLVVAECKGEVIGYDMHSIPAQDAREGTVHEAFIAILPEHQNVGLGTKLRKYSARHFQKNGFAGISSHISCENLGSLASAQKVGFQIKGEYLDEALQECRYRLVLELEQNT